MSKNKGTHGRGKESAAALEPDEFVQTVSSISDTLQPHLKKIAAVVGLLVIGLCVWQLMNWRHNEASKTATESYIAATKISEAQIVGADDADPNKGSPIPVLTYPSKEGRQSAGLDAWTDVGASHSAMGISTLIGPHKARLLLKSGQYDQALAAFKTFAKSDAPEALRMSALEGVGYSLEAKAMSNKDASARQAGLEVALQAFANLQPSEGGEMRDYSLYHQGRLMVAMGKEDEAIAKFKQVLSEQPDTALKPIVEERLESLQLGK